MLCCCMLVLVDPTWQLFWQYGYYCFKTMMNLTLMVVTIIMLVVSN